jgi:O-antigen ligase
MMLAGVALQASGHGPARLAILGGGANVYARMVASALLVLIGLGVARGRTARLLLLLALPGFATALLFAGSKAVLLAFGAALAGWAWFVGRRRTLVGAALCTAVFASAPFWTPWVVGQVDRTRGVERLVMPPDLQDPKGSYGARQRYTAQSIQLLATHGWLGVGTGDWGPAVGRPTGRQYPHNLFLELWCELGLPGLAAGVLLVAWFVGLVRRCRRAAGDRRLAATLAALFAFWILNAQLSGDLLDNRHLWWVLLLLEAVALQPAAGAARFAVANRASQPAATRSLQAERMATP